MDPQTQVPAPLRRIAVAGGGVAGWSAAAALAVRLSGAAPVAVVLVEPAAAEPGAEPLALSTLPTIRQFHELIRADEDAVLRGAGGTFKLGGRFEGWARDGSGHFEPFGAFGAGLAGASFHHVIVKLRQQGQAAALQDFSLGAVAAQLGRFSRPSEDPRSVLSTLFYALHLDAAAYARALRAYAERLGVQRLEGEIAGLERRGETVEALRLADGREVRADLFLDCTGPDARLLSELGAGWEDWSGYSPFDGYAEVVRPEAKAPPPFTAAAADASGWRTATPLQGRTAHAVFYSREASTDEAAVRRLPAGAGEPVVRRRAYGRRDRAWIGNCVAIGAAAGDPGPLDLAAHLAQSGVQRLLALLPAGGPSGMERREFNRLAAEEMERLRDFALLRQRVNQRHGEPAWDACRTTPGPDTLEYKLKLFESRGRVALYEDEIFPEDSWAGLLLGQGVWPRRYDFRIDSLPPAALNDQLRRMRSAIQTAAQAMPAHLDYIQQTGAAARTAVS